MANGKSKNRLNTWWKGKDRHMLQELMKTGGEFYYWVKPASKEEAIHLIQGSWTDSVVVVHQQEYEYRKDHTFTMCVVHHVDPPIYSGKIVRTATLEGTWTIEGDSVIIVYNPASGKLSADDSGISYTEEMGDTIKRFIDLWLVGEKPLNELKRSIKERGVKQSRATNIDLTGNRLELTNSQKETTHYKRK